jgi:hypothetical protein
MQSVCMSSEHDNETAFFELDDTSTTRSLFHEFPCASGTTNGRGPSRYRHNNREMNCIR